MKRWLWELAKRLLRSEMLRDVDAVLGQAHEHMVINARQLHVLDSALKGDLYGVGYTRSGGVKMRAIFPAQGRDKHAHLWWKNAARSIARYAALALLVVALPACTIVSQRVASPNGPDPLPTPTPSATPTPAPSPTPTPSTLVRPATVRVSPYGIDCPSPIPTPNNGAGVLPVSCVADVTATPKRADGTDLTDAEHGPAIEWTLVAVDKSVVEVSTFPGVAFNKRVRGVKVGRFRLCAVVQGVEGCWGSEASPVEVVG